MMKYNNFEEVDRDLKMLDLQRKIAFEELIGAKNEFTDAVSPISWASSLLKFGGKYGLLVLVKKLFK